VSGPLAFSSSHVAPQVSSGWGGRRRPESRGRLPESARNFSSHTRSPGASGRRIGSSAGSGWAAPRGHGRRAGAVVAGTVATRADGQSSRGIPNPKKQDVIGSITFVRCSLTVLLVWYCPGPLAAFPSVSPRLAPPTTLQPSPLEQRREPLSSGADGGGPRAERRAGCRRDEGRQWNTPVEERALGTPDSNRT
jgi:hypothetical protein